MKTNLLLCLALCYTSGISSAFAKGEPLPSSEVLVAANEVLESDYSHEYGQFSMFKEQGSWIVILNGNKCGIQVFGDIGACTRMLAMEARASLMPYLLVGSKKVFALQTEISGEFQYLKIVHDTETDEFFLLSADLSKVVDPDYHIEGAIGTAPVRWRIRLFKKLNNH